MNKELAVRIVDACEEEELEGDVEESVSGMEKSLAFRVVFVSDFGDCIQPIINKTTVTCKNGIDFMSLFIN
jgi:hypothetical protein